MPIPPRLNVIGRSRNVANGVFSNLEATNHKVTLPIKFFVYTISVSSMTIASILPTPVLEKVNIRLRKLANK